MARPRDVCPVCRTHGCTRSGRGVWRCPRCGGEFRYSEMRYYDGVEEDDARRRVDAGTSRYNRAYRASHGAVEGSMERFREANPGYDARYRANRPAQTALRRAWDGAEAEVRPVPGGYAVIAAGRLWEAREPGRAALMWCLLVLGADPPGGREATDADMCLALHKRPVAFCKPGKGPSFTPISSSWGDACAQAAWDALAALGKNRKRSCKS